MSALLQNGTETGTIMTKEMLLLRSKKALRRIRISLKWILFAVISGALIGSAGTFFYLCLSFVNLVRSKNPWLIWLLPVAGLLIVGAYQLLRDEDDPGTNLVLSAIHSGDRLPVRMAPLIFFSTLVTHLFGGSAGREGAALQLGGSIGNGLGTLFRFEEKDRNIMIMCGMSAAFSALFGTPMAAAIFAMEVVSVGVFYYAALLPCVIAALVAQAVALSFGVGPERFLLASVPSFTLRTALMTSLLAVLCALISILFCIVLHQAEHLYRRFLKNPYLRIFAGGCLVLLLTLLVGDHRYNGAGISIIEACMEGEVLPEAFLVKMIFTALTIGAGYKGGEIVPSFAVGASAGCLFGSLTGFSPQLSTAIGMGAVFCGVTNCPLTALLISFEMFGYEGMPYFLLAVAFSNLLSGYFGLYHSQKIIYSKYRMNYINRKAE
jgi:H+/Cl- antiporter ClcA